jgi:ubiquinone/menaquinone biosynthesis C-methylase UbiE
MASSRAGDDGGAEWTRLKRVYHEYLSDPRFIKRYSDEAARLELERRWEEITRVLGEQGLSFATARILDLGAGSGADCERFRRAGFRPDRIVAVDLLEEFARGARRSYSWLTSLQANAARLPFRSGTFDLVYQSTMISSVLDATWRRRILEEARRVLAPNGVFVSYDTRYRNPWNPNTRPLTTAEIRTSFAGCAIRAKSVTPIPQLVRLFGRHSRLAWSAIDKVPLLRSHLLVVANLPA